ncbi:MAG: response regulator [Oscillochloris sp.]|nr:response regulator [Oscillochloris sp.]
MRALSQAARTYLIALWSTALLLTLGSLVLFPSPPISLNDLVVALIFTVMLTLADVSAFEMEDGRAISITVALLIAAVTSLNRPMLVVVIIIGTICGALARDISWWQTASVMAVRLISVLAARLIARLHLPDAMHEPGFGDLPYTTLLALVALVGTGFLIYAIERLADGSLTALNARRPLRETISIKRAELFWYVLMLAPLGGLLATLYKINGWAFVLGIVPIVVVQNAFNNQAKLLIKSEEARRNADEASGFSNKLERLQNLMIALITSRDVPTMLNLLIERLAGLMNAANGWVVLLDDQDAPQLVASHNLPVSSRNNEPVIVPHPSSYSNILSRPRVTMITDQYVQTLAPLPELSEGLYWSALVVIPLVDEKRVMGAICLAFPEIRGLSEDEQRVLMAFARQAATVISNARLFRKVQESQAELIQSSKLAAVGTFAAGIAHEFNNLLAGMLGYAQLGLANNDTAIKNESLKVVVDTCKRGKSITGSLLTFARRREPRRELADLHEAVQGTLTLMEIELRKHNIQIERNINQVPLTICDAGQISQVFLNLLTNARDAMKETGGTLRVGLTAADGQITLSVRDTGHGIPDNIRDKIFEPFVTTKGALGGSATPGTGLGLSVSYGIVKGHGGDFLVESTPGAGTTMTIRLPVVDDPAAAAAIAEAEQSAEELPNLRLLLVDDDVSVGTSLKSLLEHIGHNVTLCSDGRTALDAYQTNEFDMVLTDLSMPQMNGIELLRALRDHAPDARVLVFTGQALEAQIREALASGALAILRKPFELEEVLKAIRSAYFQRRVAASV